jgi:hypothetical protein
VSFTERVGFGYAGLTIRQMVEALPQVRQRRVDFMKARNVGARRLSADASTSCRHDRLRWYAGPRRGVDSIAYQSVAAIRI